MGRWCSYETLHTHTCGWHVQPGLVACKKVRYAFKGPVASLLLCMYILNLANLYGASFRNWICTISVLSRERLFLSRREAEKSPLVQLILPAPKLLLLGDWKVQDPCDQFVLNKKNNFRRKNNTWGSFSLLLILYLQTYKASVRNSCLLLFLFEKPAQGIVGCTSLGRFR